MNSIGSLIPIFIHYKYAIIFPIAVIEGPIINIVSGFLVAQHFLDLKLAYAALVMGDLVGDSLSYAIGRYARQGFLFKYGHLIGITPQRLVVLENYINNNQMKTFIFGKFAHGLGYITWIATGAVRVDFWKFLRVNALTTAIKSAILVTVGFFFGQAYLTFNRYFSDASWTLFALFVIGYIIAIKTDWVGRLVAKLDME